MRRANLSNLSLLVSIFVLASVFLAALISSAVFGIPYGDLEKEFAELLGGDVDLCNIEEDSSNNQSAGDNDVCLCSVQFIANKWGFLMHGFMYVFMVLTVIYLIANVFRPGREGKMYQSPKVFSLVVSLTTILTFIFYLTWLFLWHHQQWIGGTVLLFLAVPTSWTSVVIFSFNLSTNTEELNHFHPLDLWIYRILVQNTLALVAVWTLCLLLMNLAVTLVVNGDVRDPKASEGVIIFLTFVIAVWTPLDLMVWDRVFRYMLSPFPVLIWALSSIYNRLTSDQCYDATVRVYTLTLLIIVLVVFTGRLILTGYRHIRWPLAKKE